MDPNDLRKSMIQEVKTSAAVEEEEEIQAESSRNVERLVREAKSVRARFRAIGPGPERLALQEIYETIDGLIGEIRKVGESTDTLDARNRTADFGARANALIEEAKKVTGRTETDEEKIERGRKRLLEKAAAGAGENTQRRIKDELNYLLDHYTRANDQKIEILIDKWRRSGDASYDPSVKIRYRNVRKKKDGQDYAL